MIFFYRTSKRAKNTFKPCVEVNNFPRKLSELEGEFYIFKSNLAVVAVEYAQPAISSGVMGLPADNREI